MPRHNRPKRQLIIRFKDHTGLPKSSLVFASGTKQARDHFGGGKVLRVGKMSENQQRKVGEFNDMPRRLMQEFEREERNKRQPQQNIVPNPNIIPNET